MDAATYKELSENPAYFRKSLLSATASAISEVNEGMSVHVREEGEKPFVQVPALHLNPDGDPLIHSDLSEVAMREIISALLECVGGSVGEDGEPTPQTLQLEKLVDYWSWHLSGGLSKNASQETPSK